MALNDSRSLTDDMVLEMSLRITSEDELLSLASSLGEEKMSVTCTLQRLPASVNNAASDVLRNWLRRQKNRNEAFLELLKALMVVGMEVAFHDILYEESTKIKELTY